MSKKQPEQKRANKYYSQAKARAKVALKRLKLARLKRTAKGQECTKCEGSFPLSHFPHNKKWCTQCRSEYKQKYDRRIEVVQKKKAERIEWANSPKGKAYLTEYNKTYYETVTKPKRQLERRRKKDGQL